MIEISVFSRYNVYMEIEVLNNLEYLNEKEKEELLELLNGEAKTSTIFYNNLSFIMQKWHEEFDGFDIPSGIVTISINGNNLYLPFGEKKYDENTIFDIASMSKLYTEFILFGVIDDYGISFENKISDLVDFYDSINYLTLMDLISFNNTYLTKIDIRNCTNKEDAIKALRTTYIDESKKGYYLYTDLPIMILTDVLETYTKMSYKELFKKYIIDKYDLNNTFLDINSDNYVTLNKNLTNDPKANIMGGYYGHCGVKTTCADFMKFLNNALNNKNSHLLIEKSDTLNSDGSRCIKKGKIGNSNLSVENDDSLASKYLPSDGFAIQGSVRCHGETCNFKIGDKEYRVSSSIFLDLYTQYDNILRYESKIGKKITKHYNVDNYGPLIMCDIRNLLSYKTTFKDITNLIGICRVVELNKELKEENVIHL